MYDKENLYMYDNNQSFLHLMSQTEQMFVIMAY